MIGVRNKKLLEQVNDKWRKHSEVCTEPVETQNLFAVLTGIPQRVWFHIISKSGWMGPVVVAMCLPAGVKAEPGGDDGGWDYVMDVLMVLGFVGYSVLAMGLGVMLARAFERIWWQAGQLRNILAALPGTSPSPEREVPENGGYGGKDEGKGEGKFPGKHPVEDHRLMRRWTSTTTMFGPQGPLRRRRPSTASSSMEGHPETLRVALHCGRCR